ncbi:MAG: erythromycin esterase family protein [Betaproteobacteria bacterium]
MTHVLAVMAARQLELEQALGEERYAQLRQWTITLRDSLDFVRLAHSATSWTMLNKAMATREVAMHRHVQQILAAMAPDDKLVLMGHNRHLAKNSALIRSAGGSPPGGRRVPSVGTFVNRLLPGQVFSIWMLHDHGASSQPFSWLSSEYVSIPGSLNQVLTQVGEVYLLLTAPTDPSARLLATEVAVAGIYNATYRTTLADQADAIFFARKVNPLVRLSDGGA